jgi:3,4-dihydroxy 2-butanone 4-phosphate synthase/GTP cyclohydrolase II
MNEINKYETEYLSSIEEVLEDAKKGKMFILVDDEDRENEGDLCVLAEFANAEAINFMAKYGRGLICLALERQRVETLGLEMMQQRNISRLGTAFTVSIEASEGVTTGISAADRARTIQVAINENTMSHELSTPGHVFPLVARDGGTLIRAGHTEAIVDIANAAGMTAAGVICEILKDDGTMARMPDLITFSQLHGLKVATIADLISYRLKTESTVRRSIESNFPSQFGGDWRAIVYIDTISGVEHLALVLGNITSSEAIPVRMHAVNFLGDLLGATNQDKNDVHLASAMKTISKIGKGAVVLLRDLSPTSIRDQLATINNNTSKDSWKFKNYGAGAQILVDLGLKNILLLTNNPKKPVALDSYGLKITGHQKLDT